MLRETILVFAALVALVRATEVNDCKEVVPLIKDVQISVSGCDKPVCILKQRTTVTIEAKFTTNKQIPSLFNEVSAYLSGIPLPFIGVDGTNACNNIYNIDGSKASCPMQKDTEYIYRNSFDVLPIYPKISTTVRYALRDGNDRVICFEIPSKIT